MLGVGGRWFSSRIVAHEGRMVFVSCLYGEVMACVSRWHSREFGCSVSNLLPGAGPGGRIFLHLVAFAYSVGSQSGKNVSGSRVGAVSSSQGSFPLVVYTTSQETNSVSIPPSGHLFEGSTGLNVSHPGSSVGGSATSSRGLVAWRFQ